MSLAVLSVCAWLNWVFHRRDRLGLGCALVAVGMTLGMLADIYGAFKVLHITEPLTIIISLFALGHVSYIGGMVMLARALALTGKANWTSIWTSTIVLYNLVGLTLWGDTGLSLGRSAGDARARRPAIQKTAFVRALVHFKANIKQGKGPRVFERSRRPGLSPPKSGGRV